MIFNKQMKFGAGLMAVLFVYRGYKDLSEMIDDIMSLSDKAQQSFWKMLQSGDAELVEFKLGFLKREFFSESWKMNADARAVYTNAYPAEMEHILDAGGYLRVEYRDSITP